MWPWEHLAVGYLTYSILLRATERRSPAAGGAIAVALGTQFPDVIDKTFAWLTTILPGGQSLAHSLLFAVPVIIAVGVATALADRRDLGVAFGVGYLSHLPGDVIYPVLLGGDLNLSFLLWPILAPSGSNPTAVFSYVQELFAEFGALLATPQGMYYLAFELVLLFVAFLLWVYDGTPGLPRLSRPSSGDVR